MSKRDRRGRSSHWPRVGRLVRPYRMRLVALAGSSFVGGVAEALFLVIITRVGLSVAEGEERLELVSGWEASIGEAILVGAGLVVVRLALGLLGVHLSRGLTADVRTELRHRLAHAYLGASWAVQQSEPSGRLAQLLTAFTNESTGAVYALASSLAALLSLVALVGGAFLVDPATTLAVVVALVVLGFVLAPMRRRIKLRSRAAAKAQLEFASSVSELAALGLEMQAYGVKEEFATRVDALIEREVRARRRSDVLQASLPVVFTSIAYVALLAGLGLANGGGDDLAHVGAVVLVMLRSLSYGQQLQQQSASMIQSMPFLERLDQTLAEYDADQATGGDVRPATIDPIEAVDLGFAYQADRPALEGVSFRIDRGETVGIIGPSGAGKSTLIELLLGVRDVTSGALLVGGVDLREVDRSWWRERTAFVAQDALLFTGTVAENIRFFRDGITDDDLRRAAADAHVLADIEALPDGFDTHLGERGSQLSGGQRQRLSIARALAGRPELLVLDEPTSALDARGEALVRQTFTELHGEVMVVIVAHRLSTLEHCDRLLVIEAGRLVAAGTPAEVREGNDFYRQSLELSRMLG